MPDFRAALKSGRTLLMDGAMGTEFQRTHLYREEWTEWLSQPEARKLLGAGPIKVFGSELHNLGAPKAVCAIHRAYVNAGAECLLTNSIQLNPQWLELHGWQKHFALLCRSAVDLARSAAGPERFVLASIGPIDVSFGFAALDATVQALSGADGLLLETWSGDFEKALQRATDPAVNTQQTPVIVSLSFRAPGPLLPPSGLWPYEVARIAASYPIVALGVNCGYEIEREELLTILRGYREMTDLPLLVRPNAGTPRQINGQWVYPRTAEEMAAWVPDLLQAGARLIGGCCGTTPAYIAAFRDALIALK